ncbi:BTB/POZ domain-containing protein 6-like [Paramacrobiotus metropolitanus]|uniref:BTB/POZ domain-containing protein 6-like n=1 Tax=Paramacrobiotus metropolitanus TaxID=2943436 RepID=UPI002445A3B5|nr:BTB/POZ domain-containing protein 6-like [Paramacrobiotus metropolitanus]
MPRVSGTVRLRERSAMDPLVVVPKELAISEVSLVVGRDHGQEIIFSTSKASLANASPVFHAWFYGDASEPSASIIQLPDVVPDAFANMLSHVYQDSLASLNPHNVFATLNVAEKFSLPLLVEHCRKFIFRSLRASSCLLFLDNAVQWGGKEFIKPCLEIVDAYTEVLYLPDFATLHPKTLVLLLGRKTLAAEEINIYKAAETWATAACARSNMDPSPTNRRLLLGRAFVLIRFPLLTDDQLQEVSREFQLLNPDELHKISLYKTAGIKPLPFLTAPRRPPAIRVGDVKFKHKEQVFVNDERVDCWVPAEVIAGRPTHVVVSLCHECLGGEVVLVRRGDLIRAAEFLIPRRAVLVQGEAAKYIRWENGVHSVRFLQGGGWSGPFMELRVRDVDVKAWKRGVPRAPVGSLQMPGS